jgi:uncharacterized RDD family membrane protein YckC
MNQRNGKYLERLLSTFLDLYLFYTALLIPGIPLILLRIRQGAEYAFSDAAVYLVSVLFLSIPLGALYNACFISKLGGTPGKLLFGLRVENRDSNELIDKKRAFYRFTLGYFFSSQLFGLGFLRIIKNPENLAWHDDLFFTKVLKYRSGVFGYIIFLLSPVIVGLAIYFLVNLITNTPPPVGLPPIST